MPPSSPELGIASSNELAAEFLGVVRAEPVMKLFKDIGGLIWECVVAIWPELPRNGSSEDSRVDTEVCFEEAPVRFFAKLRLRKCAVV